METKDVRVACPCCQSELTVDVRTAKVVRWNRPAEEDELGKPQPRDFDEMAKRVEKRSSGALDAFDANLAREKRRGRDLEDLFRKANEKLKDDEDDEDGG